MRRNDASAFNERQRDGYYLSALQKVGPNDDVMGGWAHAANTPGDPGAGPVDNTADMLTVGVRHWFNPKTTIILSYAHMRNSSAAHFALGPGGHGVTWDCKDGSGPSTASAGPGIGLIGNIDHLEGPARVEVFDWRKSQRTHEFPGEGSKGMVERLIFLPEGERVISLGGANDGFVWVLDLKSKSVLAQQKAPGHLYDATLGDSPETLFVAGFNRVAAYEIKG